MRNNSLDDIIKCRIDISTPTSNDESFDKILLVVEKPSISGSKTIGTDVVEISKADELLDYGYKVTDSAYIAAKVCFVQKPAPDKVYICVRTKTEATYEELKLTLDRANSSISFYGFHITSFKDKADVNKAADWAETNRKIFGFEYDNIASMPLTKSNYYRTFVVYSGLADGFETANQPSENAYVALALMAKCFGYAPGTETWHLKDLNGVYPSLLSSEQKKSLESKNINMLLRYANYNCNVGGAVIAGEWIDVIRFIDWLKDRMQYNIFSVLKNNKKIPFNDNGINLLAGKMEETLKYAQDIGGISTTEFDSSGNAISAYRISVPKSSDLTEEQRKSRKLPNCKYTARIAGAVHAVEIEGYITF